jgi:phospholipase/carboxylesterase
MMDETVVEKDAASGLVYRFRPAAKPEGTALLLFHGLTGNEDVMWVLETGLPAGGFAAAPRAPYPFEKGGYSWVPDPDHPTPEDYLTSAKLIKTWTQSLTKRHGLNLANTVFVGFSQGSALEFVAAGPAAVRPAALVALAAFLPQGDFSSLRGLPVFWGHGKQDDQIPISRARSDVARLERFGARVQLCEADVGHKVGIECMHGLSEWLAQVMKAEA